MRTTTRLLKLRDWTYETVCKGRLMKVPPPGLDITKYTEPKEPSIFIGYAPSRPDETGTLLKPDPLFVAPAITLMLDSSMAAYMEDKRFDRYNNVHRPKIFGQQMNIQALFSVYEDGVRMPGFIDKVEKDPEDFDISLIKEGTEEGFFRLLNWMDDFKKALLETQYIPGTDMLVNEESILYTLREDQKYMTDNRPMYNGFVNVQFFCYAEHGSNKEIKSILD